jgi:iron(III) transport system substrate-binding protein
MRYTKRKADQTIRQRPEGRMIHRDSRAMSGVRLLAVAGGLALTMQVSPVLAEHSVVDTRSGTVRIYVSLATSAMTKLVAAMNKHFPNLKIEFVRAGSVETVKRFVAERQAGRIGTDLIHGADPGGFEYFAQKGWLDTRLSELPLTKDYRDGFYDKKAGWIAMRATGIALMYNTKLVSKDALPKTWRELIEPKWKGRIAISEPTRAGSSFSHLYAMWKLYGEDYLERLAKNNVFVAGDGSATRDAVARGERDVAPVSEYDAFVSKNEGKPVDVAWLEDGTIMLPAPLAVVKGSPNSDNALALGEYMLSHEGQKIIADIVLTWSARRDIKAPQGKPELESIPLATFDWNNAASEKGKVLNLYFKYFQRR